MATQAQLDSLVVEVITTGAPSTIQVSSVAVDVLLNWKPLYAQVDSLAVDVLVKQPTITNVYLMVTT